MNDATADYRAPAEGPAEKVEEELTLVHAVCAWCRFRSKGETSPVRILQPNLELDPTEPHFAYLTNKVNIGDKWYWLSQQRLGGPMCLAGIRIDPVLGKPDGSTNPVSCSSRNEDGQCTRYRPSLRTRFMFWRTLPIARELK